MNSAQMVNWTWALWHCAWVKKEFRTNCQDPLVFASVKVVQNGGRKSSAERPLQLCRLVLSMLVMGIDCSRKASLSLFCSTPCGRPCWGQSMRQAIDSVNSWTTCLSLGWESIAHGPIVGIIDCHVDDHMWW